MTEKKSTPRKSPPAGGAPEAPSRLLRSARERMLWGVAGGLSERLGVDPTYVRLGFVAAAFFGGFGVLAYLLLAVIVPEDDGTGQAAVGVKPSKWAIGGLAVALLIALPGQFWGWGHGGGWWGFIGPFWLALLILGGVFAVRKLRGGSAPPGPPAPPAPPAGRAASSSTAQTAVMDTEGAGAATPRRRTDVGRALLLVLAVSAGIAAAGVLIVLSVWTAATGNGAVVAGIVIALGIGIAGAAMLDQRAAAPWLLGAALLLALPAGAVAAADVHFDGGIGERDHQPRAVAAIPDEGYEFGIGQMKVDLRELDWQPGQTVPLKTDLGIGLMIVAVPENVCVDADTKVKGGESIVRGSSNSGVDVQAEEPNATRPGSKAPRLEIDAEMQFGQLVITDDPDAYDDRGPGRHDDGEGDDSAEQDRQREACAA